LISVTEKILREKRGRKAGVEIDENLNKK